MTTRTTAARRRNTKTSFLREIAPILPAQGEWSEADYLWLTNRTNRLIELSDGRIEVLPMPTEKHQVISAYLYLALLTFIQRIGGKVFYAPLRLRVATERFREPDLLLLMAADDPRRHNEYWEGADLVVEIVSPDDPQRDLVQKRREYAEAGIPEYWIVNPQTETISVLRLDGTKYAEHGVFQRGEQAASALLAGFQVSVAAVFDAN
jgi:Uma2 family endonuclease